MMPYDWIFVKLKYNNRYIFLQMNPVQNRYQLDFNLSYTHPDASMTDAYGSSIFNRSIFHGSCTIVMRNSPSCAALSRQ